MDVSCIILGCFLLFQMAVILTMLNPMYDIRKLLVYFNRAMKSCKAYYSSIALYFFVIIYYGMFIPLLNISKLISNKIPNEYEKLVLLSRIERNYLIAGFSLFLFIVLYGVRTLVSYAASLLHISMLTSETLISRKKRFPSENILPNLLRVKRSVSYESILFANEELRMILKRVDFPHNSSPSILE
ncbi:uncharacterized protein LOC123698598 [Colias croceus]|uniref:uncharacterized protein LOC123698598 n=1 Tax=Colias crocea TaxID=72248 RepID=UPI001E27FC25|nr:uncharacterized protein LOC123698598 [Colias croceus]